MATLVASSSSLRPHDVIGRAYSQSPACGIITIIIIIIIIK